MAHALRETSERAAIACSIGTRPKDAHRKAADCPSDCPETSPCGAASRQGVPVGGPSNVHALSNARATLDH